MARRIVSALALPPDEAERVTREIEAQRASEDSVLRRLKEFSSVEELELELVTSQTFMT